MTDANKNVKTENLKGGVIVTALTMAVAWFVVVIVFLSM